MNKYAELVERMEAYKSHWLGSALIYDAAETIRALLRDRDALKIQANVLRQEKDAACVERDEAIAANLSAKVCAEHVAEFAGVGCLVCERDDLRHDIERHIQIATDMQAHIDALQARVHLCAGYEEALAEVEKYRELWKREFKVCGELAADLQRARLPNELANKLRERLAGPYAGVAEDDLLRDILAWHEGRSDE